MKREMRFDGVYTAPFLEDDFLGHADFYIRFSPDGTLRAAASFDFNNPTTDRQSPEYEYVRLGDENQNRFTGAYSVAETGFRYRIMDDCFVFEEGYGEFHDNAIKLFPAENEPLLYTFTPYCGTKFDNF